MADITPDMFSQELRALSNFQALFDGFRASPRLVQDIIVSTKDGKFAWSVATSRALTPRRARLRLEGDATLVTDEGETMLLVGTVAGFRAGSGDGHDIVDRSNAVMRLLEVGTRTAEETAHYSDIGMIYRQDADTESHFTKDGRALK